LEISVGSGKSFRIHTNGLRWPNRGQDFKVLNLVLDDEGIEGRNRYVAH